MTEKSTNNSVNNLDTLAQDQLDMRKGYANGSIGAIVSGLVWLASAFIAHHYSPKHSIWILFVGGMFIFPLSMLFSKAIGIKGAHTKGNKLANLAMEGTIFMIMCLPLAFGLSLQQTEWFFQAMLLIIGGRYLTFATIYGIKLYWIFGAVLGIAAYLLFIFKVQTLGSLLTGSFIEIPFGLIMLFSFRKENAKI